MAPLGETTPSVKVAQEEGLEQARYQPGYQDVVRLRNPHAGDPGAVQQGAEIFVRNCASCHGAEGHGDGGIASSMNPHPRNLTRISDYKAGYGDLALFRTVKYGLSGTGMVPWNGRMSDDEIWKVVSYVRTLQRPVLETTQSPVSRPATPGAG